MWFSLGGNRQNRIQIGYSPASCRWRRAFRVVQVHRFALMTSLSVSSASRIWSGVEGFRQWWRGCQLHLPSTVHISAADRNAYDRRTLRIRPFQDAHVSHS